jgi:DNA-binding NarL/FixJ family response regulator
VKKLGSEGNWQDYSPLKSSYFLEGFFMTSAKKIQVLLVDDHSILRQGLRSLLESYPNIEVVGEASNGEDAVVNAAKLQPSAVVMDITMSRMDGVTATRLIKTEYPHIAIVGLSANPKDYMEYAMLKAGAFEVLDKDSTAVELFGAIQRAVAAVQPVVILEETPTSDKTPDQPSSTDMQVTKEPKV